ncbi:hypothetical protein D3C72_2120590 [compost metagenome]
MEGYQGRAGMVGRPPLARGDARGGGELAAIGERHFAGQEERGLGAAGADAGGRLAGNFGQRAAQHGGGDEAGNVGA